MTVHATCLALYTPQGWRGLLLTGRSGAGKSDLALRLLGAGWRLVADDRTVVWTSGNKLYGRSPETIRGMIEARGLGLMSAPALDFTQIVLIAELSETAAERLPQAQSETLEGVAVPRIRLSPFEASAPAKLALAARGLFAPLGDSP